MKPGIPFLLALFAASSPAWAGRDRTPSTTPTNLRITGMTPYSVSLAWNPSTDNSGSFSYIICCANVSSETVGQQFSTHVYRAGLEALRPFTLRIVAKDAAGNYSKYSNSVSFTTPRDVTPPTKPLVSVTDVGPTHVSLTWSSIEEGPVWFGVYKDGTAIGYGGRNTSAIIPLLEPETAYNFTVRASDFASNVSPLSDPAPATTEPINPNDTTPPTTPANFYGQNWGCEVELIWDESTDDLDPQFIIEYEVYINDVYDHRLSLRYHRTIVYGAFDGLNSFSVIAVDTAGNKSAPATFSLNLDGCGS
jgi:fibronectin type III domain protein